PPARVEGPRPPPPSRSGSHSATRDPAPSSSDLCHPVRRAAHTAATYTSTAHAAAAASTGLISAPPAASRGAVRQARRFHPGSFSHGPTVLACVRSFAAARQYVASVTTCPCNGRPARNLCGTGHLQCAGGHIRCRTPYTSSYTARAARTSTPRTRRPSGSLTVTNIRNLPTGHGA